MARIVLVMGESGSGKSTAIRTLNPEETFLVRVTNKDLPFKSWTKSYKAYDKQTEKGNMFTAHIPSHIIAALDKIPKLGKFKTVIIDDFQYIMSYMFMDKAKEKGYDKFTEIGKSTFDVIKKAQELPEDVTVFFLAHTDDIFVEGMRKTKIKTIGRMLDEKITVEGLFTIVLHSVVEEEEKQLKHFFITNSNGYTTAKSPMGMFEYKIPNDLQYVLDKIHEYNN